MRICSAAFCQVVQADARGIINGDAKTTLAVKMVKLNSDESHFKSLMSELKIMIHLGQNLNVVNLLGACTKGLAKKRKNIPTKFTKKTNQLNVNRFKNQNFQIFWT